MRKHIVVGQFCLFISFLSFSLGTINRKTSCDSGILCYYYGIIRGFIGHHQPANLVWLRYHSSRLRNHTRYGDESYEVCRFGHKLCSTFTERTKTGGIYYRIGRGEVAALVLGKLPVPRRPTYLD